MYPEKWTQWENHIIDEHFKSTLKIIPRWKVVRAILVKLHMIVHPMNLSRKKWLFLLAIYWNIPKIFSSPVSLCPPMCHLFKSRKFQSRVHSFCIVVTCTTCIYWISPWVMLFKCIHQTGTVQLVLDHRCTWLVSWYHHPKVIF